jgi:hypothetical protein
MSSRASKKGVLVDIQRLRRLPEEELMRLQDEEMQHRTTHYDVLYLEELVRREVLRQGERMEELNWSINRLTWVVTGAAVLWVIVTALTLIIEG